MESIEKKRNLKKSQNFYYYRSYATKHLNLQSNLFIVKSLIIIFRKLCIVRDVVIEKKTTSKQTHPTVDMVIKDHQKPAPAPLKNVLGKCSGFAFES